MYNTITGVYYTLNNWTFLVIIFKPFKKGVALFRDIFSRNATQSFFTSLVRHLAYCFAIITSCVAFDIFVPSFLTKFYLIYIIINSTFIVYRFIHALSHINFGFILLQQ